MANIACHQKDFNIKITSYNFFATSHGKTTCDAIGGIVKRKVMRHCIRSPPEQQITTAIEMFNYAAKEIDSVKYVRSFDFIQHKM